MFINDLLDIFDPSIISKLFADDAKLYTDRDTDIIQANLNKLISWSEDCQLLIAFKKCCILNINGRISDISDHKTYNLGDFALNSQ